ncbi:unnamed protein product, partial [marine sediment metagenome]
MSEIKIFVDVSESTNNKVVICQENATKLGVINGASIEVLNPDNAKTTTAEVEISNMVLDFAGQVSKNIIDNLEFKGVELLLRPMSSTGLLTPEIKIPKVPSIKTVTQPTLTPLPIRPTQMKTKKPQPLPLPTQQPRSIQPPVSGHIPIPTKSPEPTPLPQTSPIPNLPPTPISKPTPPPQLSPTPVPPSPTPIPQTPPPQTTLPIPDKPSLPIAGQEIG